MTDDGRCATILHKYKMAAKMSTYSIGSITIKNESNKVFVLGTSAKDKFDWEKIERYAVAGDQKIVKGKDADDIIGVAPTRREVDYAGKVGSISINGGNGDDIISVVNGTGLQVESFAKGGKGADYLFLPELENSRKWSISAQGGQTKFFSRAYGITAFVDDDVEGFLNSKGEILDI